jgi:hypothetical protein
MRLPPDKMLPLLFFIFFHFGAIKVSAFCVPQIEKGNSCNACMTKNTFLIETKYRLELCAAASNPRRALYGNPYMIEKSE